MTTNQKILTGCGTTFVGGIIVLIVLIFWLGSGPDGGVLVTNEIEDYALTYIEKNKILDDGEKLLAYYDVTMSLDGTEAAMITDKRVIYHKNLKNSFINFTDIDTVIHVSDGLGGDVFEISSVDGEVIKVNVAVLNGGDVFDRFLTANMKKSRLKKSDGGQKDE